MLSLTEVKNEVVRVIGETCLTNKLNYVSNANPSLWGEQQPRNFLENSTILTLYKDITGKG
jgi:hypothetical protein